MLAHPSIDIMQNAIYAYAQDNSTTQLTHILRAFCNLMTEGYEMYIPTVEVPNNEGQMGLQTRTTDAGEVYVVAYTTEGQVQLAAKLANDVTSTISTPLVNYIGAILQMDGIFGLVINPHDKYPFTIQKPMLGELLQEFQKSPLRNAISVERKDITTMECDCIVNAANASLLGGGGVDGAIHTAAGPQLLAECKRLGGCATGEAKITFGYKLHTPYVIHTVGPVYNGDVKQREELAACYTNSLNLAKQHHLHSIAFPAISTGAYHYPLEEATNIAYLAVVNWLNANKAYGMHVIFTCYNSAVYKAYKNVIDLSRP